MLDWKGFSIKICPYWLVYDKADGVINANRYYLVNADNDMFSNSITSIYLVYEYLEGTLVSFADPSVLY